MTNLVLRGNQTTTPLGSGETYTGPWEDVSTDANDTAAGSGARTVQIFGLDENFQQASEIITLSGLTPAVSTGLFSRVHSANVQSSGSSNAAYNAGTLTVSHSTTTANVFLTILPGRNQSNAAVFTIPSEKRGIVTRIAVEVDRANTSSVDGVLWTREFGKSPRLRRPFTASNTSSWQEKPYGGLTLPAQTDLSLRVTSCTANNTIVYGQFDIVLIDDD